MLFCGISWGMSSFPPQGEEFKKEKAIYLLPERQLWKMGWTKRLKKSEILFSSVNRFPLSRRHILLRKFSLQFSLFPRRLSEIQIIMIEEWKMSSYCRAFDNITFTYDLCCFTQCVLVLFTCVQYVYSLSPLTTVE